MFDPKKKRLRQSFRRDSRERAAGTSLFSPLSRVRKKAWPSLPGWLPALIWIMATSEPWGGGEAAGSSTAHRSHLRWVSHRGQHPVRCLLHREYWTEVCSVEVAVVYLKEPMTRALRKFSISGKATGSQPVILEMKPSLQELEPQAFHPWLCKKILSFGTLHLLNTADCF